MKNLLLSFAILTANMMYSQWSLTGNSGTIPSTSQVGTLANYNFIGTIDAKDFVFTTNGLERMRLNTRGALQIGDIPFSPNNADEKLMVGGRTLVLGSAQSDLVDFVNTADNVPAGSDALWIAYTKYQSNDVGLISLSSIPAAGQPYENRFTVRANGKASFGNFNFNCSDCVNYRLFVKDGIRTEKVKVDISSTAGWADYVFDSDYKLLPLENVKKYIDENKHLPEVPNAKDVVENGVELKEMSVLLLKKVEELTLYIIDQNKRIEELERANKK